MQASDNSNSFGDRSDDDLGHGEPDFPPIPTELEYLVEPGLQYGRKYQFDDAVQWFLENAEESDVETLATLAERARLSGDYRRFLQWTYELSDVADRIVDEHYPYTIDISDERRKEFLQMISKVPDPPDVAERWREKRLRQLAESDDCSDLAERRRKMRMRLGTKVNDEVHDMDIYFLFGLMDACDMEFEST